MLPSGDGVAETLPADRTRVARFKLQSGTGPAGWTVMAVALGSCRRGLQTAASADPDAESTVSCTCSAARKRSRNFSCPRAEYSDSVNRR